MDWAFSALNGVVALYMQYCHQNRQNMRPYPSDLPSPRVSVILPAFNEEKWIHIALDSLKQQTIPFELIIIDNESTDETATIARTYTPNVISAPRGIMNARQEGIINASGDVVVLADADCYYPPTFLETLTRHFKDPNVVLVTGLVDNTGKTNSFGTYLRLSFMRHTNGPVTAYRRKAFLESGGYKLDVDQLDFLTTVIYGEININWKISMLGRIVYEANAIAYHADRRAMCPCNIEQDPEHICDYCGEIIERQRF